MSFFENLFSSISSVLDGDNPNYGSWSYTLENKADAVMDCLATLLEKSDRVSKLQDNLKRVQMAMVELVPELDLETFSGDQRNIIHQQHVRSILLKLWNRLLIALEKIGEPRYLILFLDVISKIIVRTEFDCENLSLRSPLEFLNEFKKYRKLMQLTFSLICERLGETKPLPATTSFSYQMELPQVYARLLTVLFFRLPEVSSELLGCLKIPSEFVTYNLLDYEFTLPPNSELLFDHESASPALALSLPVPPNNPSPPTSFSTLASGNAPASAAVAEASTKKKRSGLQKRQPTRFPPQKKIVVVEKDMSGEPSKLNANTHTTNGNTNTEDVSIKPTSESNVELNIDKSGKTESSQAGDDIDGNTISEKKAEKEETSGEANVNQPEQQFEQIIEKPEDTDKQEGKAEQYPSQMQHEHEHHYLKKERQERRRSDKNGHRGGDIVVEPLKPQDPNLLPICLSIERNLKIPRTPTHIQEFPRLFGWSEFHALLKTHEERLNAQHHQFHHLNHSQYTGRQTNPSSHPNVHNHYTSFNNSSPTAETATATETSTPTIQMPAETAPTPTASTTTAADEDIAFEKQEAKTWHQWLSPNSILPLFIVTEFVNHVTSMASKPWFIPIADSGSVRVITTKRKIDWRVVRGYKTLVNIFLHTLRHAPRFTNSLMNACNCLLKTCPLLLNYYMRFSCSRTIAFQQNAVTDVLTRIAEWFSELKKSHTTLPANFDSDFFCNVIDMILESDHHQMICRLLYHGSELVLGNPRKAIYSEFLVKKYFFALFLHWDEVSRNYFMQLLLFKVLRYKTSQLGGSDGVVSFPQKSRCGVVFSDTEFNNDRALFGKVLCYVKIIEDQQKRPGTPNPLLPKHLEVYATRALKEYKYFVGRSENFQGTEWKVAPMMLLDPHFRNTYNSPSKERFAK